ncbi:MAG: hypothetical protein R6X16_03325 [Anaerolineae bacterium]
MRHGYTRWAMCVIIMSLLAGVLAGCRSRPSSGTAAATAEEGAVRAAASVVLPTSAPPTATPVPAPPTAEPPPVESSGDPLVYPGAYRVEIPDDFAADSLEQLKYAEHWIPPIGVPVGTPLILYGTPDDRTLVENYYAASLPEDGWTFVREWENVVMHITQWSKGSDQLTVVISHDFSEAFVYVWNEKYGLDLRADHVGISVLLWKE